jgi:PhnB protein
MAKAKSYIPEGFHTVTPFLMVDGADELIEFMTKGFGGQKIYEMRGEDKKITHASVKIGNSIIMLGDTMGDMKPEGAMLYLYVEDVNSVFKKAVEAKAESVKEPEDQFYGDRAGCVKDKWGNTWWIATQIEEVDNAELERRAKEAYKKQKQEVPTH